MTAKVEPFPGIQFPHKRGRSPEIGPPAETSKAHRSAMERFRMPNVSLDIPIDDIQDTNIQYYALVDGQPLMPRYGYKSPKQITDSFNQQALQIQRDGLYRWGDRLIALDLSYDKTDTRRTVSCGAHYLMSHIPDNEHPLIDGINNQSIVIKTFVQQSILSRDSKIAIDDGAAFQILLMYGQLKHNGLPIAVLFNQETALSSGYFLFEYVPDLYRPNWPVDATIENNQDLAVINNLFRFAAENRIALDLKPSHLRRRNDGSLVLIDFLLNPLIKKKSLYETLEKSICTFCQKGDPIYNQLHETVAEILSPSMPD